MNRLMSSLMLCSLSLIFAGADAPPATNPNRVDPAKMVASNPQLEAIMAKVPQNLIPPADKTKDDSGNRHKRQREWDKANVDGQRVKVKAYRVSSVMAAYYTPEGVHVEIGAGGGQAALGGMQKGEAVEIEGTLGKGGLLILRNNSGEIRYCFGLDLKDVKVTKIAE